jgi:hypothetical protein
MSYGMSGLGSSASIPSPDSSLKPDLRSVLKQFLRGPTPLGLASGGQAVLRIRIRIRIRNRIRIRIHRINLFLGLLDPDPDSLVRGTDPDPDPSIIKQK